RFFAGRNAAVGDAIAQSIGGNAAFFRDDAEKFVVHFHDETLHELAFLLRHRSGAIEHSVKLAAFENDGGEADFVEELFVVQRLNDDADAAGDGGLVRHDESTAAGNVVAARRGERVHIDDDWFDGAQFADGIVNLIRSSDFAAGRIDFQNNGLYALVIA